MDIATLSALILSLVTPDPSFILPNIVTLVLLIIRSPPDPSFEIYHRVSEGRNEMWLGRDFPFFLIIDMRFTVLVEKHQKLSCKC